MESLLAAAPFHVVAFSSVSSPSAHSPSVLRSIRGGGRAVRCAAAKVRRVLFPDSKWDRVLFVLQKNLHSSVSQEAILYALEHDEMFNSEEVIQWESGKTINSIAAAQGIRIRRRCRPRYPSEGSGDDKAVPRNILEQIVWDKEVEVSQVQK